MFNRLKYMLDCGFNLMLYGVGSKLDLVNLFVQKNLQSQSSVLIFNGFHSGCNMKRIVDDIVSYLLKEVYKGLITDRKQLFPKNVTMHEQIMNIKREFRKQYNKQSAALLDAEDDSYAHMINA